MAQPPGYDFIRHRGKVVRHPTEKLPWRIYVTKESHFEAFLHAVRAWNEAGHHMGYPDLFAPVVNLRDADMVVDWSGKGLPADKAGGVFWSFGDGQARITKMVMDPLHQIPEGNRSQILLQELGHALGLGDSSDPRDVMHPRMHSRRYRRGEFAKLTSRDLEAFRWLYSRQSFVPIVSTSLRETSPALSEQLEAAVSGALMVEPIRVEVTASVSVRLVLRNPSQESVRGPLALELWGRALGDSSWMSLKTWQGLDQVPAGYRVSRDYFGDLQPLFLGNFELLCRVYRTDTKEVLGEGHYP